MSPLKQRNFNVKFNGSLAEVKSVEVPNDPSKTLIVVQCHKTDNEMDRITKEAFNQFKASGAKQQEIVMNNNVKVLSCHIDSDKQTECLRKLHISEADIQKAKQ